MGTGWKAPGMTPDEHMYLVHAAQASRLPWWRFPALVRMQCEEWLKMPELHCMPSPLRWLWTWLTRWIGLGMWARLALSTACDVACFPFGGMPAVALSAWSPLGRAISLRQLQDTTVAALTLAAIALAWHGHPVLAAVVCVTLLCVKEAGALMLPAVCLAGWFGFYRHLHELFPEPGFYRLYPVLALHALPPLAAVPVWLLLTRLVCGPLTWEVMLAAKAGHATDYTKAHQSGMWHRLAVDLMLCSPAATVVAIWSRHQLVFVAAVIVLTHSMAPVRNARTILAADLLLRAAAGLWLFSYGWLGLLAVIGLCFVDWSIGRRLCGLRDTPTAALAQAVGAVP